jgi:hypothetical protein
MLLTGKAFQPTWMFSKRPRCGEHQTGKMFPNSKGVSEPGTASLRDASTSKNHPRAITFTTLRLFSVEDQGHNKHMRPWLFRAALLLALLTTPLWAQRGGGGHGGMGGGGHVSGGFSGGAHGATGYSAARGGSAYAYHGSGPNGWAGNGGRGYAWRGNGWYGGRYPYRPWGWGYGWGGYPYWGWGVGWGFYPGWGWYGDSGGYESNAYVDQYPPDAYAPTYPSVVYLAPDGSVSTQPPPPTDQRQSTPTAPASPKMTEVPDGAVLVYRDGHTETVENYAIVGKTVWVFTESRARKIPLSTLDIPATQRDNQDRGSDFVVPSSSQ